METKTGKSKEYYSSLLECFYYQQMIQEVCSGDDAGYNRRKIVTLEDCISAKKAADMWMSHAMENCL